MTSRDLVLTVLAGDKPDRVPFIIWDNKLPSPEIERRLLELGACVIVKTRSPNNAPHSLSKGKLSSSTGQVDEHA